MKKTKFQRITAFILALTFLLCGSVMSVGAATNSSVSNTTTSDIQELLNAISYSDYIANQGHVPRATTSVEIDAIANLDQSTDEDGKKMTTAAVKEVEYEGKKGLYIPGTGTVSWITDQVPAGEHRYNVVVEYYPVENKAASIEREFMINGEVPFSEARYLTIARLWDNVYPDAEFEVPEGETAQGYLDRAAAVGMQAESLERDGKTYIKFKMPEKWTEGISALTDELGLRFFSADIDANEIRSSLTETPTWVQYEVKDSNGFFREPFEFVIAPDATGKVSLSMESVNEPIVISKIYLTVPEDTRTYSQYLEQYGSMPNGTGTVKIEGEYFSGTSSQTIYPVADSTSAITSPSSTDKMLLNTVGGDKWQTAGQWIEYTFSVDESGMYQIAPRFKQSLLDGMYTSRMLYIYSEGLAEGANGYYDGLPFAEAGSLKFDFDSDWQSGVLTDGTTQFKFYFEKGVTYTLRFEVSLGSMGDVVRRVQTSLEAINTDYLNILKLTGSTPDELRDYRFSSVMPETMIDLVRQSRELKAVSEQLTAAAEVKSSMTATLDKVARLLDLMGKDDDEVAKNLEQLKTYIGSLGTWLSDAKTQPLTLDYISIQPEGAELPQAKAGFWKAIGYEIMSFVKSFLRNYNRMGALTETTDEDTVEVWLAYGRDQSQVIRGLINNDFTPNTNVAVDLKLVAANTLLPSILSGMGPDVYIGLAQADVINYAIRGALIEVQDMAQYQEAISDFNEAAMMVLQLEDSSGKVHCYGLPETQNFTMMFVREDILAELKIEIPKTWDDVKEAIPVLQANNMQIGMQSDVKIFLYQMGGDLFADKGMRINLDSPVALEAFDTMCEMFTMYSFPYKYDFANRFRTGEMPIGFATYTATYNQLKVFATEIEGMWGFYPMPGYYVGNTSEINNASVSTVTAIVMITGCENQAGAWEFMKWHADDQCQVEYSNEMVAILGPSAKHATANEAALESLPWTAKEYEQLSYQFNNLASVPNYPGSYIIDRYTKFAFLDAYDDNADPATAIQGYITTINKEITRKRAEFAEWGLETLDYVGQTLAQKRMAQVETLLNECKASSFYNGVYDVTSDNILELIAGYETEQFASLRSLAAEFERLNGEHLPTVGDSEDATTFKNNMNTVVRYLRDAADALESYEASKL